MALKITLVRSLNSCKKNQIATAYSLGLRKINSETTQPDNEATKGKIKTIAHLVKVEEVCFNGTPGSRREVPTNSNYT